MKSKLPATMFLAVVTVAIFAASAGAVDGTIEINDAKVKAAGGYPYKISGKGSYRLTSNLKPPASTDGIDVSASNVTVDLNGFAIIGPGSSVITPVGISALSVSEVTVENGTVTGFGIGVDLGDFGIVRNLHADVNGSGIQTGNDSLVEGCTANNCTLAIEPAINCGAASTIRGNTANGNADVGIDCVSNGCVISGNTANANSVGIDCTGSGCLISGNVVFNNSTGIEASDANSGFGGNVLKSTTKDFSGAHSLGNNLCSGASC